MNHERSIRRQRQRRRYRVRKRLRGTPERPRLSVFRKTLVAASTLDESLRGAIKYGGNKVAAGQVGQAIGQRAVAAGVTRVAFDRGPYKYHGRVAALAEGAREAGLEL